MPADPSQPKVVVVMPAYNAARTLVRTYRDIPRASSTTSSWSTTCPATTPWPWPSC